MSTDDELDPLERAVLRRLLRGEHPALRALRKQLGASRVRSRDLTGAGFFTSIEVDPDVPAAPVSKSEFRIWGVEASIPGLEHGAGFLILVRNGYLSELEAFTYQEDWPEAVTDFQLHEADEATRLDELA